MGKLYAHTLPGDTHPNNWHLLEDHLVGTAELAGKFARDAGLSCEDWAYQAGLWHDLGKARPPFQQKLGVPVDREHVGYTADTQHAIVGAIQSIERYGPIGRVLAYPIAGHHGGLPDWQTGMRGDLIQRLEKKTLWEEAIAAYGPDDLWETAAASSRPRPGIDHAFFIRMLYSCLVDADFLDTEAFMAGDRAVQRGGYPPLAELLPKFERFMAEIESRAGNTTVNLIRKKINSRCLEMAEEPPGIYTLTVPTGGGKTLASLGFALRHALRHGMRRVIYVIPYLSIIEQTADIFRRIFGEAMIEHHSGMVEDGQTLNAGLSSENWDAPVIVTTAVQFFESLFNNRPGRCRKLHSIPLSVVVLDEAQLLPPDFLKPILKYLDELSRHYGVTILLCTATQPALKPIRSEDFAFEGLTVQAEIVNHPEGLHEELRRVRVRLPRDLNRTRTWESIADELTAFRQCLCIVNKRGDALELFELMPAGTFHLSASMCGEHRSRIVARIKEKLKKKEPVQVISTQLIECGVDVDFPVVYRALAGLDSIAQAAGRANREGLLEYGECVVFVPPQPSPPGHLRQAEQAARLILGRQPKDPLALDLFSEYFRNLYWAKGPDLDRRRILKDLAPSRELKFSFQTASKKFKIIDQTETVTLIVRYGPGAAICDRLLDEGLDYSLVRQSQRFSVGISSRQAVRLVETGQIVNLSEGLFIQLDPNLYDQQVGIRPDKPAGFEPEYFII